MADIGVQGSFSMHSGDDRVLEFTINNQTDAAPENITGATMTFAISKPSAGSSTPAPAGAALVTKTVGAGIVLVTPASGRANVTLAPADTAALKGTYYYELQVVLGGVTSTVAFGSVLIYNDLVV